MKNKQTAVEWLVRKLSNELIDEIPLHRWDEIREAVQKAKQMEKVMNEYSWIAGAEYSILLLKDKTAKGSKESFEEYYNETYNK